MMADPHGCRRHYLVGGLEVCADRSLGDLPTVGWADGSLVLTFADSGFPSTEGPDWIALGHSGVAGWARRDGSEAVLAHDPGDPAVRAWQVRQLIPFVAALSNRLVLHAAGVRLDRFAYAFVGASGRGKSTLAQRLAGRGLEVLADDLLPCRLPQDGPAVPHHQGMTPLGGLFFLDRRGHERHCHPLTPVQTLTALAENGFGELADAEVWSVQFDAYHRIAADVPAFHLVLPNSLDTLESSVDWLLADLLTVRR